MYLWYIRSGVLKVKTIINMSNAIGALRRRKKFESFDSMENEFTMSLSVNTFEKNL